MNNLNENLSFLKQNSKSLYNTVKKEEAIFDVEINSIENQDNYYVKNGNVNCFLHSIYDVNREMEESFSKVPEDVENLILFGIGCGHYVDYISGRYHNLNKVIILEPSLDIFKKLLEKRRLYEIIEKVDTATFILNKDTIETTLILIEMLEKNLKRKTAIVYNLAYKSLFEEYFNHVENNLSNYLRATITNTATKELFKEKWLINTLRNIKKKSPFFIEGLSNEFKGHTAFLVSGGPSLEKNMHLLKETYDKSVIFAVGSAIKILDSNSITPHFRVAIDGGEGQLKIFQNIDTEASNLIYAISGFHEIFDLYKGDIFKMIFKSEFLIKYIYDKSKIKYESIDTGNSVANVALDLICKLGFDRVVFMGQDLCYTENKLYAKGSWTQKNIKDLGEEKEKLIQTIDIYGENVYTSIPFLNMKKSIETKIIEYSKVNFINCTEGGLNICGAESKKLKEVLDELGSKEIDIERIIKKIKSEYSHDDYIKKLERGILSLKNDLKYIYDLNESIIEIIKNIDCKNTNEKLIIKALENINEKDEKMKSNELYEKVINPYIGELLNAIEFSVNSKDIGEYSENREEKIKISLNKSVEIKYYLDLMDLLIEELEGKRRLNIKYQ